MNFLVFEPTYYGKKDEEYVLKFKNKDLMFFEEQESQCMYELTAQLNEIILQYETEAEIYKQMLNIFIELLTNTLSDKMDDIDTLYAMKTMMQAICDELENLAENVGSLYSSAEGFNETFNTLNKRLEND